ncbi:hypothetical protein AAHZ94_04450 [Streptomyces sp. HSW2009]|uniref:hypothetical protein n=1 Tax=Streptomyces sp. HSW2009 TaxID=3142890 RepID=UPI0032EB7F1C
MDETNRRELPRVVVYPPLDGRRRVTIDGRDVGVAVAPDEVALMMRRAGVPADRIALDDPDLVEWQGGGRDAWLAAPPG